MRNFIAVLVLTLLLAISACATGLKRRGQLSSQEVEDYMQRGLIASIFIGHKANFIRLDNGKKFTATLPDLEIIAAYVEHRKAIGKPIAYQME